MAAITNESDGYYAAGNQHAGVPAPPTGHDKIAPRKVYKPPKRKPPSHEQKMAERIGGSIYRSMFGKEDNAE